MHQKNHKQFNEQGFASIAIALILIVVLSLLTIGFAQLARREQQSALNKQLANQAYYAAESGVNDAYKAIKSGTLTQTIIDNNGGTNSCLDLSSLPGTGQADISNKNGVSYSCVLVNLTPTALVKDIAADGDWSTYFSTVGGPPDSVTLNWNSNSGKSRRATNDGFTPSDTWNATAVMQFSVTPLNNYTRSGLVGNTFTVYAYPSGSSGSVTYSTSPDAQGKVIDGNCASGSSGPCHVQIDGLPSAPLYAIHVHDYYDASHVLVSAHAGPTLLALGDSQATIDVTGKAREVLKRILVHVPIHPSPDLPNQALQAQNICKRFTTDPVANTQNAFASLGYGPGVTNACDVTN
jgi:Tfp pilus assembly protein PilX